MWPQWYLFNRSWWATCCLQEQTLELLLIYLCWQVPYWEPVREHVNWYMQLVNVTEQVKKFPDINVPGFWLDPKIIFKMFPDPGPRFRSGPGKLGVSGCPASLLSTNVYFMYLWNVIDVRIEQRWNLESWIDTILPTKQLLILGDGADVLHICTQTNILSKRCN